MKEFTGGPLNLLNGKMGISNPKTSVPVMLLIKKHNPRSRQELLDLISIHYYEDCYCGIKSTGTVEDFGKRLYDSQLKFWGKYRYSLKDCIQWEYDLFVVQSLKGQIMENQAKSLLEVNLEGCQILEVDEFLDSEYRIDLLIKNESGIICGIQVKPSTFTMVREEVVYMQRSKNNQWTHPVYTLYYGLDSAFSNLNDVISKINSIK